MARFFLIGFAIKTWPLIKDEVAELAKSVLRDIAREEAKNGLKSAVKAGAEGLKGLLEATPAPPAPPTEVVDPFQQELLVEAAVCVDDAPALPRLLPRQGLFSLFGDDRALKALAPSLEAILGRLGGEIEPTVETILRGKMVSPALQSALRCRLELPAVKEVLARKMTTGGLQSIDCSTLRAFASRARAAGPCSITVATSGAGAGAGAEALHLALPSVMDFIVYTSAAGVIALVLYLVWRGPGNDE